MTRVVGLVRDSVVALATRPERVAYTDPPPRPRPPVLGITLAREPEPHGVPIGSVAPDGPAAEAGLRDGDVIVALAGQIVRTVQDLRAVLVRLEPGKSVEIVVLRDGERVTSEIAPAERGRR
jgi:S1-C subfamily serine protease